MQPKTITLFDNQRLDIEGSIELSLASLTEYGRRYRHWAMAYSGGKDSTATVTFVAWAIASGLIPAPDSLTVMYADTRQEIPPLQQTAMNLLSDLASSSNFSTQVVMPALDDRYFVYMLGRGVPPPNNQTFRWCTEQLKIEPMYQALAELRERTGEKFLMLTGVRIGESAARDQKIAVSCSRDSGECGQGWYQMSTPSSIADTLAPLLHWRLCHVWDWLYLERDRHGYDVRTIATVYGQGDVRTGCIGCPLTDKDTALINLVKSPEFEHLKPLLELKPLYRELRKPKNRLRKSEPERRKNGKFGIEERLKRPKIDFETATDDWTELKEQVKKLPKRKRPRDTSQRLGPITMKARKYGLEKVLSVQQRTGVDLINPEEEARIRELWQSNTWPQKWTGDEITGDVPIDAIRLTLAGEITVQSLLIS